MTLEPGGSWIEYAKLQEKTDSCQVSHTSLIHSGRVRTIIDDGTGGDSGTGEGGIVPPGQKTGVGGDEPMHRNRLLRNRGWYQGTQVVIGLTMNL